MVHTSEGSIHIHVWFHSIYLRYIVGKYTSRLRGWAL